MVFKQQKHTPPLSVRQAALDGVRHPTEAVIHREPFPRLNPPLRLDQIVEAALFAEAARVHSDRRYAHFVGEIDAVESVVDVLLAHVCIVVYKVLVNREVVKVEAESEGMSLEPLQIRVLLRFHLTVQYLHP